MNRFAALLVFLAYGLAMGGTALRVHECGGTWMTELSMVQPMGTSALACHRKGCEKDCCRHPAITVKVLQDQQASGIYQLRSYFLSSSFPFSTDSARLANQEVSLLATSIHGPPGIHLSGPAQRAWLGCYLI